jgi:peptidylprolyl isomerase
MKHTFLILLLAACAITANAQTASKPASTAKPASEAKPAVEAKPAATPEKPREHMPALEGTPKNLYTINLSYIDSKIGTGAAAEPKKLLKFNFALWLAADGSQFDSSDAHRAPVLDSEKKPVLDENGKPKLGDPQPMSTMMGSGRPLPGWDMGFEGMKVGGKRRIFIPWQLGFGNRELPARDANHPAVPAKSDLIVDVELLDVTDAPERPMHPMMPPRMGAPGATPRQATPAAPAAQKTAPATPPAAPQPPAK